MPSLIVCVDSDHDEDTGILAAHRRREVYPALRAIGHELCDHRLQRATRLQLKQSLLQPNVGYLTGSGHGGTNQFQGINNEVLLAQGAYDAEEVSDRIIHLLACEAGSELGPNMVLNGCRAFFGYTIKFIYYRDYVDEFLAPAVVLDLAIAQGCTAQQAHDRVMQAYQRSLERLEARNVHPNVIGFLEANRDNFCSPSKDSRWGDVDARL